MSTETLEDFKILVLDNFEMISNSGFAKPVTRLTVDDKVTVVLSVALHEVMKTLGELSQFQDGLESLGVASAMKEHGVLREFFVKEKSKLTAGMQVFYSKRVMMLLLPPCYFCADYVRNVFKNIKFSEKGSNAYVREQNAFMMLVDYLEECETGITI